MTVTPSFSSLLWSQQPWCNISYPPAKVPKLLHCQTSRHWAKLESGAPPTSPRQELRVQKIHFPWWGPRWCLAEPLRFSRALATPLPLSFVHSHTYHLCCCGMASTETGAKKGHLKDGSPWTAALPRHWGKWVWELMQFVSLVPRKNGEFGNGALRTAW